LFVTLTVAEFEGKLSTEVIRQENIDQVEDRNFLEKYIAKMLYG